MLTDLFCEQAGFSHTHCLYLRLNPYEVPCFVNLCLCGNRWSFVWLRYGGYTQFSAISLAPLGWLLMSEFFPLAVRGVGMSIGSLAHCGFNAMIAYTFLKLVNSIGMAATFWMDSPIGLAGRVWGYFYIAETRGKSLEEIEDHWRQGRNPRPL